MLYDYNFILAGLLILGIYSVFVDTVHNFITNYMLIQLTNDILSLYIIKCHWLIESDIDSIVVICTNQVSVIYTEN
jgi:hypothetical protein